MLVAACAETTGPHLSSVTPAASGHNTVVTIAGSRLCDGDCVHAAGMFDIGSVRASVIALSDTSAMLSIPDIAPAGKTSIVLTVNDSASNALAFEVLP